MDGLLILDIRMAVHSIKVGLISAMGAINWSPDKQTQISR